MKTMQLAGITVLFLDETGPLLESEQAALDLMGEAYGKDCDMIAVPVGRLPDSFFDLSTRIAGLAMQKFTNYRLCVAFIGNISEHLERSRALRDFVGETNARKQIVFARDEADLAAILTR